MRCRSRGRNRSSTHATRIHAVKITFANEIGRLLSAVDVDARDVMRVFCEDDHLNISSAYLRPGFSFGGSCLPKDLRALMHIARIADIDVPMLNGVMPSNESHLRLAARRILDTGERVLAMLGLSFKPQTDDLRESPYVELAEFLGGKGIEVRIFDPIIQPARLFGSNRQYVEKHLPHLQRMLCSSPDDALRGAGIAVVATSDGDVLRAVLDAPPRVVLDLPRLREPRAGGAAGLFRHRVVTGGEDVHGRRVLIIVQNLSVPFDRRVWLEACSLRDAGFQVSVVCPMGAGDKTQEVLDGILIRRYPPPPDTRGFATYVYEFAYCWLRTARLVLRAHRAEGFDVIQACNPPDTFWALALPFKLAGRRFVFDQHDLCPEVYESRFPNGSRTSPWPPPPRAGHVRRCRSRDLDERLVSSHRHPTGERGERGHHGRSDRTGS